jgi:hypothetical protein
LYVEEPTSKHFLAICPSLNIFLEADTRSELFSLVSESIDALFTNVVKSGDLNQFLIECGWQEDASRISSAANIMPIPRFTLDPVSLHDFQAAACG